MFLMRQDDNDYRRYGADVLTRDIDSLWTNLDRSRSVSYFRKEKLKSKLTSQPLFVRDAIRSMKDGDHRCKYQVKRLWMWSEMSRSREYEPVSPRVALGFLEQARVLKELILSIPNFRPEDNAITESWLKAIVCEYEGVLAAVGHPGY